MKSWRAERFGPTNEVLRLGEVDLPKPEPGKGACSCSGSAGYSDAAWRPSVSEPSHSPGMQVAGEVTMVGEGSRYQPGDHVMAIAASIKRWGALAEYCLADEKNSLRIPASMPDTEAVGFMVVYKTAYAALAIRTSIQPGETLLVLGAAGSTGGATVLLGKALGARIIAVAGSAERLAFCREIGADHGVNHKDGAITERVKELTDGRGVNVVFDPVGGELARQAMQSMARHGRFGFAGNASGEWVLINVLDALLRIIR